MSMNTILTPRNSSWFRTIHFVGHFCVCLSLISTLYAGDDEKQIAVISGSETIKMKFNDDAEEFLLPIREARPMQPEKLEIDTVWARRDIRSIPVDIREKAEMAPQDRSAELDYGTGIWEDQYFNPSVFSWVAPDIYYAQLYFEDVALERYGQTCGPYREFFRSGAHFFRSVVTLPNKFRNERPCELDSPLGYCRPGSPAPLTRTRHYRSVHRYKGF